PAVAVLPPEARGSRAADRDSQRARRAEGGACRLRRGRFGARPTAIVPDPLAPSLERARRRVAEPSGRRLPSPPACPECAAAAITLLAREPATGEAIVVARKVDVVRVVGEAAGPMGMVGGQAGDLQAAGQVPGHAVTLDADGLRAMHARKTGALIRASAVSGAIMAGASNDQVAAVDAYATEVGLAFQIVDDILDVRS